MTNTNIIFTYLPQIHKKDQNQTQNRHSSNHNNLLVFFCIFFFCPSRCSVFFNHLYAILLYLLPSTITSSHHCSFHVQACIYVSPAIAGLLVILTHNMLLSSLLITGLQKQTSHKLLIFSSLGQDTIKKTKESKQKTPPLNFCEIVPGFGVTVETPRIGKASAEKIMSTLWNLSFLTVPMHC